MIFSALWWIDALKRGGRTALVLIVPFVTGGTPVGELDFVTIGLIAALGFVTSILTSLRGIPEITGEPMPLWKALLLRAARSFGQGVLTGIGTAALLTDVDWNIAIQLGLGGAVGSVVLGLLSHLPETIPVDEHVGMHEEVVFDYDAEVEDTPPAYTRHTSSGYVEPPLFPEDDDRL